MDCEYSIASKACQKNHGKHFSATKNRCICLNGESKYDASKFRCVPNPTEVKHQHTPHTLTATTELVCPAGKEKMGRICFWTDKSSDCQDAQNGEYWSEISQSCFCRQGTYWDANLKVCVESCPVGKRFDGKTLQCTWTENSLTCQDTSPGGEYWLEGDIKECVCKAGWLYNKKK